MKITVLIMAGGKGQRFWPRSRSSFPKQFLSFLDDGKSMIQHTVERILPLVDIEDIFIVTNKEYRELIEEQLSDVPKENIICEPMSKNTAPCIGLGAVYISKKYDDAVMIVLPSDHMIKNTKMFIEIFKEACDVAEKSENLITIGIKPNYPETGYGYIKYDSMQKEGQAYKVDRFVEKPDEDTARSYIEEGSYLWNSGMFVWKVSTILNCYKKFIPSTYEGLIRIKSAIYEENILEKEFALLEAKSIDYAIMEKAENIMIFPVHFGWDDVGSWCAVSRLNDLDSDGNIIKGNVVAVNTSNCILEGQKKLIATVGLKDIVIVDTSDAILIADKDCTNDIKGVLEQLEKMGKTNYL